MVQNYYRGLVLRLHMFGITAFVTISLFSVNGDYRVEYRADQPSVTAAVQSNL